MSNRELAHKLIDNIPTSQLKYVIGILQNIKILNIPEVEPDELDLQMIHESQNDVSESIDFNDFVTEMGFDPNELQN